MDHHTGVQAAAARAHGAAVQRSKAHGGGHAFAVQHRAQRHAVAQVRHHGAACGQRRHLGFGGARHVFIRQAMKAVAPHAVFMKAPGQRKHLRLRRLAMVKGGVKAGHLRQVWPLGQQAANGRQVVRLVQRRQGHQGFELLQNTGVYPNWLGKQRAAMYHPVADRHQLLAHHVRAQPGKQPGQCRMLAADGVAAKAGVMQRHTRAVLDLEMRLVANIADLAAQKALQTGGRQVKHLKLQAR